MPEAPLLEQLLDALRCLPGVGPKSAQRMGLHLLERDREGARRLAELIQVALARIGHCERCRNLTEQPTCALCRDAQRDRSLLCVVETPSDLLAIERSRHYRGLYHVLMGRLSPLDGLGPDELGLPLLAQRLAAGEIKEVILATNATVEGEVTAHYIGELAKAHGVAISRLAYGIPLGGELGYVSGETLAHAFAGRRGW